MTAATTTPASSGPRCSPCSTGRTSPDVTPGAQARAGRAGHGPAPPAQPVADEDDGRERGRGDDRRAHEPAGPGLARLAVVRGEREQPGEPGDEQRGRRPLGAADGAAFEAGVERQREDQGEDADRLHERHRAQAEGHHVHPGAARHRGDAAPPQRHPHQGPEELAAVAGLGALVRGARGGEALERGGQRVEERRAEGQQDGDDRVRHQRRARRGGSHAPDRPTLVSSSPRRPSTPTVRPTRPGVRAPPPPAMLCPLVRPGRRRERG